MSYFIAQSISISKKGISLYGDDNNVFPKINRTTVLPYTEENLKELFHEIDWGCIQPTDSANGYRWWYIQNQIYSDKSLDTFEKKYEKFKELLGEKEPAGEYFVNLPDYGYLFKDGRKYYCWLKQRADKFPYWKAKFLENKYAYCKAQLEKAE